MGHGAAAVLVSDGAVRAALDYEAAIPAEIERAYAAERDPFAATLSPAARRRPQPRRPALHAGAAPSAESGPRAAS